jgi:hypothetical protein
MHGIAYDDRTRPERRSAGAGLTLERRPDGRLMATVFGSAHAVQVHRCFPWTEPARFVSLRNADGEEVVFVEDPAGLDEESRSALEDALADAGFIFDVTGVAEIEEEVELRRWVVRTAQGTRTFETRLDDWPRELPGGGLLIRDISGDLYRLEDAESLDRESRALLWAFVD